MERDGSCDGYLNFLFVYFVCVFTHASAHKSSRPALVSAPLLPLLLSFVSPATQLLNVPRRTKTRGSLGIPQASAQDEDRRSSPLCGLSSRLGSGACPNADNAGLPSPRPNIPLSPCSQESCGIPCLSCSVSKCLARTQFEGGRLYPM